MIDPDDLGTKPEEIPGWINNPAFQQRRIDPDDEPTRPEEISNLGERPEWQQKQSDVANEYIKFLDNAIRMLQPVDLFSGQRDSNEWLNLHSPKSKNMLATIHIWIEEHKDHSLVGEMSHKVGITIALLKKRFNNADVFNDFNKDVGRRIKRLRDNANRREIYSFSLFLAVSG